MSRLLPSNARRRDILASFALPVCLAILGISKFSAHSANAQQTGQVASVTTTKGGTGGLPEVTASAHRDRVTIKVNGKLFAEYLTRSGTRPVLWPVIGPTGHAMTRAFPVSQKQEHEHSDHLHHRSIWFGYEGVGGYDFWTEPEAGKRRRLPNGEIVHREFVEVSSRDNIATVVTRNDWMGAGQEKVCSDEWTLHFGADADFRWIDFRIELKASEGALEIGDSKEGVLGVRVAGKMKVDAQMGGRILNSDGLQDSKAWGLPARGVDYSGPVEDEIAGIAMFSHPDNSRHPCRWHVRAYGLFAANPFGEKDFPSATVQQGPLTIEADKSLTLKYRILLHEGRSSRDVLDQEYRRFAND